MTTLMAADPAVPLRDDLLDPGTFAARYAGPDARPLGLARARYRFGESLRVVHRVAISNRITHVTARSSGERVDVTRLPADRKIEALPALLTGDLAALVGEQIDERRLAAYAPERSAAVACLAHGVVVAYVKAFAGDEAEQTERTHRYLSQAAPGLGTPRLLGRRGHLVAVEAIAGRPLRELEGASYWLGLRRLGAVLAELHATLPPPGAPRFRRHDVHSLRAAVETVTQARPELAGPANRVADALAAAPPSSADACLHGDVHGGNALVTAGGIALIDLDDVSRGPAAADLGSFFATLRYRQLTGAESGSRTERAIASVLEGYGSTVPPAAAIAWHEAAALLVERAQRAITRVRPDGLAALPAILAAAHERAMEATCRGC